MALDQFAKESNQLELEPSTGHDNCHLKPPVSKVRCILSKQKYHANQVCYVTLWCLWSVLVVAPNSNGDSMGRSAVYISIYTFNAAIVCQT